MTNVRKFLGGEKLDPVKEKENVIEMAKSLLADLESGTITSFVAVGIDKSKSTFYYSGCTEDITRLSSTGAVYGLLNWLNNRS